MTLRLEVRRVATEIGIATLARASRSATYKQVKPDHIPVLVRGDLRGGTIMGRKDRKASERARHV